MSDDRALVKGYAYLSYVEPLVGDREELWSRIVANLPAESRAFFAQEIFADQWYPRTHLHALMDAMDRATGGNEREFRELGAMAARFQLGAIYRVFLSFMSPAMVFRRAGSIWRRQSTAGEFRVVEDGDFFLVGELDDRDLPSRIPLVMAGWTDTIVTMLGRTPYPTQPEAIGRGKWRFHVRWIVA